MTCYCDCHRSGVPQHKACEMCKNSHMNPNKMLLLFSDQDAEDLKEMILEWRAKK